MITVLLEYRLRLGPMITITGQIFFLITLIIIKKYDYDYDYNVDLID